MTKQFADTIVYKWLSLEPGTALADSLAFFIYDSVKIFGLLAVMIFLIGFVRTWLPQERLKRWMGSGGIWANILAASFGAITPFCSCSSIPIFITMLKAGIPLGVTLSFLITSPIINEYLVIIMAAEFGLPITSAYVASGLTIGTVGGAVIGRMRMEHLLETDIIESAEGREEESTYGSFGARVRFGVGEAVDVIKRIWLWVLVGVGIGALIHNYIPQETIHGAMQVTGIFSVPIATVLGVPMYGSCAAIVPIAVVLFEKGVPLGTALAFMMAMAALSLPEAVMLRRVMRLGLIGLFFGVTTLAIVATGYLLNSLAQFL